jgi:P27 family predicted phage terminase small subunit
MTGTRGPVSKSRSERWLSGTGNPAATAQSSGATASQPRLTRLLMPKELEGAAAELWRAVVPGLVKAGWATRADVPALTDMCQCWQRIQECEHQLAREGLTLMGARGETVKHPTVTIVKSYRESFQKYLQKFGLQPMDRQRLPATEDVVSEPSLAEQLYAQAAAHAAAAVEGFDDD